MPFFGGGGGSGGAGDYTILTNNNIQGGNNNFALLLGVDNMALNNGALENIQGGNRNIAIGKNSLNELVDELDNIKVGTKISNYQLLGNQNIFVGNGTGEASTLSSVTGADNVFIGHNAGANWTVTSGGDQVISRCVFIGTLAGYSFYGATDPADQEYVAIGYQADSFDISGFYPAVVAIGSRSGGGDVVVGKNSVGGANSVLIGSNLTASAISNEIKIGKNAVDYRRQILGAFEYVTDTWANRPALVDIKEGGFFFATDIGVRGCLFQKRGGVWTCPRTVFDTELTQPNVTGVTEQIVVQGLFPAGLIRDGAIIKFLAKTDKSGATDSFTIRTRLGTLGTVADTTIMSPNPAATVRSSYSEHGIVRINNTSVSRLGTGAVGQFGTGTATYQNSTTVNTDAQFYVSGTLQLGGATDTLTVNYAEITMELP